VCSGPVLLHEQGFPDDHQVGQREQGTQLRGVPGQTAIAQLLMAKQVLDDGERVLDPGPGRRQGGQHGQALGRSRGGFSTRIRLKAEFDGLPPASHLTGARPGGAASDSRQFDILLDIGPDITPGAAPTDKRYDAAPNRQAARERHIRPILPRRATIPRRATARYRPSFFPKTLHRGRARIEQTVGKLKRFERGALGCEKTAENDAALISPARGLSLVKSVHTT
jgi:hypothetical protein